jgi:hypothetical protein
VLAQSVTKGPKMCFIFCLHALWRLNLWRLLGLDGIINDASQIDRSGSVVLEHILRLQDNTLSGFRTVNLKEVVSAAGGSDAVELIMKTSHHYMSVNFMFYLLQPTLLGLQRNKRMMRQLSGKDLDRGK